MPGFAFVDRPWQAFACAVVGGAGVGAARTANQTLLITLVTPEQRAASFTLGRVASNLGLGSLATVAGFIVASAQHLRSFQTLYLFDAMACAKAIAAGDPSYRTVRGILAAGAERDQLPAAAAAGDGGAAAFLRGPGIDQERRHACLDRPEVVRPVAVPAKTASPGPIPSVYRALSRVNNRTRPGWWWTQVRQPTRQARVRAKP
jgi:MFS family permease